MITFYYSIHAGTVSVVLDKPLVIFGAILSLSTLYWIARSRSGFLVVPLPFATICASIWIILSSPAVGGGAYFTLQTICGQGWS